MVGTAAQLSATINQHCWLFTILTIKVYNYTYYLLTTDFKSVSTNAIYHLYLLLHTDLWTKAKDKEMET